MDTRESFSVLLDALMGERVQAEDEMKFAEKKLAQIDQEIEQVTQIRDRRFGPVVWTSDTAFRFDPTKVTTGEPDPSETTAFLLYHVRLTPGETTAQYADRLASRLTSPAKDKRKLLSSTLGHLASGKSPKLKKDELGRWNPIEPYTE